MSYILKEKNKIYILKTSLSKQCKSNSLTTRYIWIDIIAHNYFFFLNHSFYRKYSVLNNYVKKKKKKFYIAFSLEKKT